MRVRQRRPEDGVAAFLAARHSARVARRGELVDPLDHPSLVAIDDDGGLAGVLTYVIGATSCEVLTLHAARRFGGVGTALLDAVRETARDAGCKRIWLITTNDNVDALRFYQRRGFRIAAVHVGAVDESRARLKPEIPEIGDHGIPIRDEIELVREVLGGALPPSTP